MYSSFLKFFFNDTATTEIYTLSLHDALPIQAEDGIRDYRVTGVQTCALPIRSEEHTSELQSHDNLVCRLLLDTRGFRRASRSMRHARGSERTASGSYRRLPTSTASGSFRSTVAPGWSSSRSSRRS